MITELTQVFLCEGVLWFYANGSPFTYAYNIISALVSIK